MRVPSYSPLTVNSMRRFLARPAGVSLGATGLEVAGSIGDIHNLAAEKGAGDEGSPRVSGIGASKPAAATAATCIPRASGSGAHRGGRPTQFPREGKAGSASRPTPRAP
jgi:hypothetical protein